MFVAVIKFHDKTNLTEIKKVLLAYSSWGIQRSGLWKPWSCHLTSTVRKQKEGLERCLSHSEPHCSCGGPQLGTRHHTTSCNYSSRRVSAHSHTVDFQKQRTRNTSDWPAPFFSYVYSRTKGRELVSPTFKVWRPTSINIISHRHGHKPTIPHKNIWSLAS